MASVAPAPNNALLQKNHSTGNIEKIPQSDQDAETAKDSSLQDSKRLGFAKSFNRLSASNESSQPENINEKLKSTFVDFCSVVEKGVNDALLARFNLIHGISTPKRDLSHERLGGSHLQLDRDDKKQQQNEEGTPLSQQKKLAHSGSMASLHHSRAASRGRQESPGGLRHNRSLHRAASGRVRSAGKCAACYLSKEESYKLRLTIEARIRCPPAVPDLPPLPPLPLNAIPTGNGGGSGGRWATTNDDNNNNNNNNNNSPQNGLSREHSKASISTRDSGEHHNAASNDPPPQTNNNNNNTNNANRPSPQNPLLKKASSKSQSNLHSQQSLLMDEGKPPTTAEQAKDIRNAITAIINDMPEPIPGTPIIIMFNAIVYHEAAGGGGGVGGTDGGDQADYALAFSWKSETNTPCGAMIKELKQQRMEQAYKDQGVELDSVKAEAAAAAALAEQSTLVGKLKGIFKIGSQRSLKKSTSNLE
ncbi:hypothetical protein BDR26DRAFT_1007722 [Obelidium mucronatum]|nr:hypothetical protein BDR26DRAFT_1007722 [Obelidium mucronatum]